jgi:predicted metalloendopeptidase
MVSLFVILGLGLHMSSNVCLSGECVELAFNVIKGMNRSVDPCVDFYQFTCGGWDYANVLPEGYGIWSKFGILNKRNHIAIKKLLDGSELNDVRAIKLARNVYKSCMDLTGLTYQGAEPILRLINSTGGWDLIGLRNATAPSWSPNSANFVMSKLLGNHGFFKFKIIIDDKNSSQYVSSLKQDGLTLPSELLYTDPRQINNSIPALRKYITSILKLLGPSVDDDVYSQAADNIISFETDLAKIYISKVELRDPVATYNRMTLADLSSGSYWRQVPHYCIIKHSLLHICIVQLDGFRNRLLQNE